MVFLRFAYSLLYKALAYHCSGSKSVKFSSPSNISGLYNRIAVIGSEIVNSQEKLIKHIYVHIHTSPCILLSPPVGIVF